MKIKEALDWGKKQLSAFEYPFLESEVLLSYAVDRNRAFLKMFSSYELEEDELSLYIEYIEKRKENIPVAYIVEKKDWGGFDIVVTPDVLIPRDETEVLCHHITSLGRIPKRILDVGTGSGAIALFLKRFFPESFVLGIDISQEALKIAQKNALRYDLDVQFRISDLLSEVFETDWDVIVANLPYIPEKMTLSLDVKKEPSLALFGGKEGIDFLQRLADELKSRAFNFSELWIEFLPKQKTQIELIFDEYTIEFQKNVEGEIFFAKITR